MFTARQLAEALTNTGQGPGRQRLDSLRWEDMTPEAQDQATQNAEKVMDYMLEKKRVWA